MTQHKEVVARLCERHGAETKSFRKKVMAALKEGTPDDWVEDDGVWVVPDVFRIDKEARIVSVWEVEDTSLIKQEKAEAYGHLWFWLDCYEWDLVVMRVDRYGQVEFPLPCQEHWYASVFRDAGDDKTFITPESLSDMESL